MRRETCICEIPTCWAICDCVNPSKKRRWRMRRSRSSSARRPGSRTARSSLTSYSCSSSPRDSSGSRSELSSPAAGADRESVAYAWPLSSASSTSSSSTAAAVASSAIVGERSSCTVSSSMRCERRTLSSCSPRGTRTDQPLSRKWRLISPMMLGVAYVVSSTPRSRSKRSIALISPIAPLRQLDPFAAFPPRHRDVVAHRRQDSLEVERLTGCPREIDGDIAVVKGSDLGVDVVLADANAHGDIVLVTPVPREHRVECERQIVERFYRQLMPCRQATEDEMRDAVERVVCGQRQRDLVCVQSCLLHRPHVCKRRSHRLGSGPAQVTTRKLTRTDSTDQARRSPAPTTASSSYRTAAWP